MRKVVFFGWLLVPVVAGAYHYGPGQDHLILDRAGDHVRAAEQAVASGQWAKAAASYETALTLLPESRKAENQRLRLEKAKAQMHAGQLPEARADLESLVDEMASDKGANAAVLADARGTLASSQYYMTWLMRLEGVPRELWEPEIDSARQNYKLLAEQAETSGEKEAALQRSEDLESAIRLARMDLKDLQGVPLPKQCCGCCSGNCKKPGGKKPGKKPGQKKEDARGAGMGPPPDGSGS